MVRNTPHSPDYIRQRPRGASLHDIGHLRAAGHPTVTESAGGYGNEFRIARAQQRHEILERRLGEFVLKRIGRGIGPRGILGIEFFQYGQDEVLLILTAEDAEGGEKLSSVAFCRPLLTDVQCKFVPDYKAIDLCLQAFLEFADLLP